MCAAGYRKMDAVEYRRAFTDEQLAMMCAHFDRRIDSLGAENKQLRELVRFALHRCNTDNPMCDECRDHYDGVCELEQRMRELGVDL